MDLSDIKIFHYKKLDVVFKVLFKEVAFTNKDEKDTIALEENSKPNEQDKIINIKKKYYNVSSLFPNN